MMNYCLSKLILFVFVYVKLIGMMQYAREDVAFQVLACLNVLLYSGNEEAQKKISKLINEESRGIFVRVHQILSTAQSSLTQAR